MRPSACHPQQQPGGQDAATARPPRMRTRCVAEPEQCGLDTQQARENPCLSRGLSRSPDRIRTGATALRGRRARPLHNGAESGSDSIRRERRGSNRRVDVAGVLGLEPRLTGPEPVGLPITPYPMGSEREPTCDCTGAVEPQPIDPDGSGSRRNRPPEGLGVGAANDLERQRQSPADAGGPAAHGGRLRPSGVRPARSRVGPASAPARAAPATRTAAATPDAPWRRLGPGRRPAAA
jgi:hypothetical protein